MYMQNNSNVPLGRGYFGTTAQSVELDAAKSRQLSSIWRRRPRAAAELQSSIQAVCSFVNIHNSDHRYCSNAAEGVVWS